MKREVSKRENDRKKERREFLKKGLYTAPKLIILGSLAKPEDSKAGFGPPPSDPDCGQWGCDN